MLRQGEYEAILSSHEGELDALAHLAWELGVLDALNLIKLDRERDGIPDKLLLRTLAVLPFVEATGLSASANTLFEDAAMLLQLGYTALQIQTGFNQRRGKDYLEKPAHSRPFHPDVLRGALQLSRLLERFKESHVCFTCKDGQYIQLALLSRDDPLLAPAGKHTLYVGMLVPYETWEPFKGNENAYRDRKAAFAEEIITRADEFIPGLRAHIKVQEAASLLTFERYTSNWRGGTAGWNWNPQYAPHFDFARDLPIKNFYAVGHYIFNPGGVPTAMITAWYIAREILKRAIA